MRYWLFDGNDVIGPLTPQCIAQRVGFSPSFLVCPEQESENARAWKPAASFDDFNLNTNSSVPKKQNPTNSLGVSPERKSAPVTQTPSVNTAKTRPVRHIQPVLTLSNEQTPIQESMFRTFPRKDTFSFSAIPISQVEKDEIILPLRSIRQETNSLVKTPSVLETKTKVAPVRTQQTVLSTPKRTSVRQTSEVQMPTRTLHSLPILGVSESRLPLVPEETDYPFSWKDSLQPKPSYSTPSSIAVQRQEERLKQWKVSSVALSAGTNALPLPNSVLTPLTGFSDTVEELVPTPRPVPVKETVSPRATVPPQKAVVTPVVKKPTIPPATRQVRAAQEPEEELPASLKKSSTRSTRNVLFGILCIFLTLVCLGVGYQIFPRLKWNGVPRAVAATTARPAISSGIKTSSKMQSIPTPPPPQAVTVPLAQEEAVRIVKGYSLSNGRGTVETYLNHLYGTHLAQGYQASWSAEPLHKSTYIVKYRLAKTRVEPIVYVFQADTATGQLTGALNNITLDLVDKV